MMIKTRLLATTAAWLLTSGLALAQTPPVFTGAGGQAAVPGRQGDGPSLSQVTNAFANKCDVNASNCPVTAPGGVPRTLATRSTDIIQAADYGMKCDGTTDDSPALRAANAAGWALGGRQIMVPANGHACRLATGNIAVSSASGSGNRLVGSAGGMYWPGPYDNTESHWTAFGTWFRCEDTVNSCILLNGNGSSIENINFWYTQPTPPGSACGFTCTMQFAWTPTQYPYAITVGDAQNFNSIRNVSIINGSHCINVQGADSGVSTIYTSIEHVRTGCFNVGLRMNKIDNTVSITDFRTQPWWFPFNPNVVGYTMGNAAHPGHRIGWDFSYVSGLQANNVEFYLDAIGINATDDTVTSGLGNVTFAVQAGQWSNISFNQVCQAIKVATSTTHFNARLANVILNVDPQTSGVGTQQCGLATPYAFDLASDNVDVSIANLDGYLVQSLARVGAGASGVLHINGARVQGYSQYADGAPAVQVAAGAGLDMPGDLNALRTTRPGAGPRVSGLGNFPHTTLGLDVEGTPGTVRQLRFLNQATSAATNGGLSTSLWSLTTDSTAQSGGNAGANIGLYRYSDTGAFIDAPISVPRATGVPFLPNGMQAAFPTSCSSKPSGTVWNNAGALSVCP